MSQITVNVDLCKRDGACVAACPSGALRIAGNGSPEEAPGSNCILCGHCVAVCPNAALAHSGLPDEAILPVPEGLPTPAALDGLLLSRRSVREFKDQPIGQETLESLLDLARRAPTAVNSQKLHWIVAGDAATVRALSAEAMNWVRTSGMNWSSFLESRDEGYDFIMRGAPAAVVACTPADYDWGAVDCTIALTFLELAAEARGLGVCWAGFLTRVARVHAPLCQALSVPEGYVVHGALMLGERKYTYRRVPPRKPLSVQWL